MDLHFIQSQCHKEYMLKYCNSVYKDMKSIQYAPNCLEHRKCIKMYLKCPTIVLNCLHILDYIFMVDLKSQNLYMGTHYTLGPKFIFFQNARIQTIFECLKKSYFKFNQITRTPAYNDGELFFEQNR